MGSIRYVRTRDCYNQRRGFEISRCLLMARRKRWISLDQNLCRPFTKELLFIDKFELRLIQRVHSRTRTVQSSPWLGIQEYFHSSAFAGSQSSGPHVYPVGSAVPKPIFFVSRHLLTRPRTPQESRSVSTTLGKTLAKSSKSMIEVSTAARLGVPSVQSVRDLQVSWFKGNRVSIEISRSGAKA